MKPISNGEGEEGDDENEKARSSFTLLEFVDAGAGKKKATGRQARKTKSVFDLLRRKRTIFWVVVEVLFSTWI